MKKIFYVLVTISILGLTSSTAFAGTIRVHSDNNYTVKLKCSGSSKSVKIGKGTTTVTFHSSSNECDIVGGDVKWPTSKMKNGGKWKISGGKAKKN